MTLLELARRSSIRSRISALPGFQWNASICLRESPTSESPCRRAWSRKVSGWSFASVDQPERHLGEVDRHRVLVHAVEAALGDSRRAKMTSSSSGGIAGTSPWACQASTSASPSWRQASTRNAPEPIAGSQTLRSRICAGRGGLPSSPRRRARIGSSVVRTIGSVSARGV